MDDYGHLFPGQEADAVARAADLIPKLAEPFAMTGTQGRMLSDARNGAQRLGQQLGRDWVRPDASAGESSSERNTAEDRRNSLRFAPLSDTAPLNEAGRRGASPCESASSQTRTENPLIKSQML